MTEKKYKIGQTWFDGIVERKIMTQDKWDTTYSEGGVIHKITRDGFSIWVRKKGAYLVN